MGIPTGKLQNHESRISALEQTAGGGFSIITTGSTIDDSNTVFTFSSTPTLVCINGAFYKSTGGQYTWTGSNPITLNQAVGTGGSVFGIK